MPVYVDRLYIHNKSYCHLFADDIEELYHFGNQLGLNNKNIHKSKIGILHYNISNNKRKIAIKSGAIYLQKRHLLKKLKQLTKE